MTYRQLYEDAINKLDHGMITVGEYEKMIEPLEKEIDQEHAQPVVKDINVPVKDCISRKAAIAEIARWIGYLDEDMINRIQIGLNRLPSAQSEWDDLLIICGNCDHTIHVSKRNSQHIIRCKDCKYASPNGTYGCVLERFSPHDKSERLFSNDFCSLAEVKADENN